VAKQEYFCGRLAFWFFQELYCSQPNQFYSGLATPATSVKPLAPYLVSASAVIFLLLGLAHLRMTFSGTKLWARDPELQVRMQEVSPVITRQTTMWRAWIGFNASHSFGLIFFGAVYGYLGLMRGDFLFDSAFLLSLGLMLLLGYALVAKRYFFRVPFRSVIFAAFLYALGLAVGWS
jgi:hypothetical protein